MTASERLRALWEESADNPDASLRLANATLYLADVVEAAERRGDGVSVIRALGFVGNSHYCPSCLNTFHDDCGQHKPDCQSLAGMLEDEDWPDFQPMPALTALRDALDGGDVPSTCAGGHDTSEILWPGTAHQGVVCRRCKVFLPC